MSNLFGFVSDDSFTKKCDAIIAALNDVAFGVGGRSTPATWNAIQGVVRSGKAPQVFAVGDQLTCKKGDTTLIWDIIGFDHDVPTNSALTHSMTLQLHDIYKNMRFNARQAFYYCSDGLTAGTYNVTIGAHPWVPSDVNKTFNFTLTQDVPAGGQLVFFQAYNASCIGAYLRSFSGATSKTQIELVLTSEGATGTSLGTLDNTQHGNFNSITIALVGNNRWKESGIRQYLNSSAVVGSVWAPQSIWDRLPDWAETENGWMYDIDDEFLSVIGFVNKITARDTIFGGGSETTIEKFFLVGKEEAYMGQENNVDEGGAYEYYSLFSDLSSAGTGADGNRRKMLNDAYSTWLLRTPFIGTQAQDRSVISTGAMSNIFASNNGGVVVACNIV